MLQEKEPSHPIPSELLPARLRSMFGGSHVRDQVSCERWLLRSILDGLLLAFKGMVWKEMYDLRSGKPLLWVYRTLPSCGRRRSNFDLFVLLCGILYAS